MEEAVAVFGPIPDMAGYLLSGYWADHPYPNSYGGGRMWRAPSEVSVNISDLTVPERALARAALQLWDDISNINFNITETSVPTGSITFINDGGASALTPHTVNNGWLQTATIQISSEWSDGSNT